MDSLRVSQRVLAGLAMILLVGSSGVFAYSGSEGNSNRAQSLTFAVGSLTNPVGAIANFGDQKYTVTGGSVVLPLSSVLGNPFSAASIHFSLSAEVRGLSVSGYAKFYLTGTSGGFPISVNGSYRINNAETSTPANAIQNLGSGTCTWMAENACSELPLSFIGDANLLVTVGNAQPVSLKETIIMENPYLNPFGAPIVIASTDLAMVIVATYDVGTIVWSGTSVAGTLTGQLGSGQSSTQVTGMLSLNSTEIEDLVAGTATDSGQVALSGMSPSSLNVNGTYTGSSVIPTAGERDCSATLGFPTFPAGQGICTQTGFNSAGQYVMRTGSNNNERVNHNDRGQARVQVTVVGQYATTWTVPALAFSTSGTATVTTNQSSDD